jgi:hypothetical protein
MEEDFIDWRSILLCHGLADYVRVDKIVPDLQMYSRSGVEAFNDEIVAGQRGVDDDAIANCHNGPVRVVAQRKHGIATDYGQCVILVSGDATARVASIKRIDAHPIADEPSGRCCGRVVMG